MLSRARSSYATSLNQLFDEDLTGIFEASPEGRIRTCNDAFARLFGFAAPAAALGTDLSALDPEGTLAARIASLRADDGPILGQTPAGEPSGHALSGSATSAGHLPVRHFSPMGGAVAPGGGALGEAMGGPLGGAIGSALLGSLIDRSATDPAAWPDTEAELRRVDGRVLHVVARLVGRFDERDTLTAVTGYLIDDTPRKALQVQVRHAMKMETVGRLAGGIAHDFNNLLMIIIGLSEGLVEQMRPDDPLRADAVQILEAGRRGSALASQVLAFSRKPLARAARFDADEAITATTPLIARLVGSGITLDVTCAPEPKWISADRAQLEQVLLNLATNAHDAMPNGGRLTLETLISTSGPERHGAAATRPRVVIKMRDTGTGMSPETQAHIFEPFFTTKARGKGTGLGLAQVHAIVTEHGGIIDVDSADGLGTTFTISLPLASGPEPDKS